jgi:CBS domain-containing protein
MVRMNVGELCTRTVVVARGDEHVLVAGARMRDEHVGCLVVVADEEDGTRPIGIVTDRDLLGALVGTEPRRLGELKVAEVMSWDLLTAREVDDVHAAVEQMRSRGVRRLPVVDGRGVLVGILAYDDLVEWMGEQLAELSKLVAMEQRRERRS